MIRRDPILDQDVLIGKYVLGLLSPKDNARLQAQLGADTVAARSALRWEEAFLDLADALLPAQPPQQLLEQVLTALDLPLTPEDEADVLDTTSLTNPSGPGREPQPSPCRTSALPRDTVQTSAPDRVSAPPHKPSDTLSRSTAMPATRQPDAFAERDSHHHVGDESPPSIDRQFAPQPRTTAPAPAAAKHKPGAEAPAGASHPVGAKQRTSRKVWFGGAAAGLMLVALLTLAFLPSAPVEPPIVIVEVAPSKGAILQAPGQSSTPGWVVTIDQSNNVTLSPQVHTEMATDASVQLWTYNKTLPQPRSLGLIDPNQPVTVPASIMGEIGDDQFFEMTLEPEGGSPTQEPTGPILFIGRVVTFSQ